MRIEPSQAPQPPDPQKNKVGRGSSSDSSSGEVSKSDTFSGPAMGQLMQNLQSMDGVDQALVDSVKKELSSGTYFTEERIQKTIEKLSTLL